MRYDRALFKAAALYELPVSDKAYAKHRPPQAQPVYRGGSAGAGISRGPAA